MKSEGPANSNHGFGDTRIRPGRNTTTGRVLEQMVVPALLQGGYQYNAYVNIGKRPNGSKHIVDVVAAKSHFKQILVSLKWQQSSGTAEQKVPFEMICLLHAISESAGQFEKAFIVLGGPGWKLRDYYVGGGLKTYIPKSNSVRIVALESFIALANTGRL